MQGRTIILVSHHVQMCAPGASYIVTLDNGRVQFSGSTADFYASGVIRSLVQSTPPEETDDEAEKASLQMVEGQVLAGDAEQTSESSSTLTHPQPASLKQDKKPAKKLVEEEKRAVGRISRDIWETYIWACRNVWYWIIFTVILVLASASPVLENGWLRFVFFVKKSAYELNIS